MIDTSILFKQVAPVYPDPVKQRAQQLALQQAQQQNQIGQQTIQGNDMSLQAKQQALQDQETVRQALVQTNGDINKAIPLVAGHVAPATLMNLQKQYLANANTASTIGKNISQAGLNDANIKQKQIDLVGGLASAVHFASPANQPAAYQQAKAQAEAAQPGSTKNWPAEWGPQASALVDSTMKQAITAKDQIAQQQAASNAAETNRHNSATEGQSAATLANTASYQKQTLGQGDQRIDIERQRLALERQRLSQQGALANASPGQVDYLTKIANGDLPLPSKRSKTYQATMEAVLQIDPTYTESRYNGIKGFKTGKDSNTLVTMTTALNHLQDSKETSAALGFEPSISLNVTPAQHKYSADVNLLTGELGKLVTGGVVSKDEKESIEKNLYSSLQSNRDAALDELSKLMAGKIKGITQKFKNSTGMNLLTTKFISQETADQLKALGFNGEGATPQPQAVGAQPQPQAATAPQPSAPQARKSLDKMF